MNFEHCEICGPEGWSETYRGALRDGVFGNTREQVSVATCAGCGVDRLAEQCVPPNSWLHYQSPTGSARINTIAPWPTICGVAIASAPVGPIASV